METVYKISLFVISFLIILHIFTSYLYPAYISTQVDCMPVNTTINSNFVIGGQFIVENNTPSITMYNANPKDLRHELCHYRQYQEGRLSNCNENRFWLYTNELECYVTS